MIGIASIVQADARAIPLADNSVDLIVTSPPYYGLRSYTDGGEHYAGQIGSEKTPAEWLQAMLQCTRECVRVIKPSGSIWVNLGDKYSAPRRGPNGSSSALTNGAQYRIARNKASGGEPKYGIPRKSLLGLPWRFAIACMDELGLILRAEVVWSKPNGLPESVTDRVRRSHETWFHFVTEPRYYAALDDIREPYMHTSIVRGVVKSPRGRVLDAAATPLTGGRNEWQAGPLGALPGSVREVATEPLKVPAHLGVDHFDAFPTEWPRWIIRGWSPSGICSACGEGRRPVADTAMTADRKGRRQRIVDLAMDGAHGPDGRGGERWKRLVAITGEACACPEPTAPTSPAVVLDPFGGTGTTALVSKALGRHGISIDRSADYCRIAAWRTTHPGELAKAMRVDRPPVELVGQDTLFDVAGAP